MRLVRTVLHLALALSPALIACRTPGRRVVVAPVTTASPEPAAALRTAGSGGSDALLAEGSTVVGSDRQRAIVPIRLDTAAGRNDVARAVVAVFGDTTGIPDSAALAVDDAPAWDLDVRSYETHARVAHYVGLFSGSAKDRFLARLSRGTRYEPMIRAKLRAGGLPEDMTFLALIESGYDPNAYSKAAAVGMWQFMSSTARDVGMRVDWWVDERRDPARSTDGAIRFLGDLQRQFGGSLYLAAAAYNGGPGRVSRGLTRFADEMGGSAGEDRFFALAEQDYLRAETKNYVPQLIAAALVAKMPERYGIVIDSAPPYAYDSVRVAPGTSLAAVSAAGATTVADLRELNPAILRGITPPDATYWVKVPVGSADRTRDALDALPESARRGYTTKTVSGSKFTLASFAAAADVSTKALAAFNPGLKTTRKGRLVSGQTIRVPAGDALTLARDVPDPSIERYGTSAGGTLARGGYHLVRRGETMGAVARRYGISVARLKSLNGIKGSKLVSGQTIRVKGAAKKAAFSKRVASPKKTSAKKSSAKKSSAKKSASAKKKAPTSRKKTSAPARKTAGTAR